MPNIVPASAQGLPLFLAYREWLHNEAVILGAELFEGFYGKNANKIVPQNTGVGDFHFPSGKEWWKMPPASGRAAIVMGSVGVDFSAIRQSPYDLEIWHTIRSGGAFAKKEA